MGKGKPSARKVKEAIAAVMANTKCKKRKLDALEVAQKIEVARQVLGSLAKVAENTVLSYEMVRQIHSILKCNDRVKELIKQREIDSFDVLHRLSKLPSPDQGPVAEAVVAGELDSDDVRGIVNLRSDFPRLPIERLVERIKASRNIKHYIAYFMVPEGRRSPDVFQARFTEALGQDSVVSVRLSGRFGTLTLSAEGRRRLQAEASQKGVTKRQFLQELIAKRAE